MSVRHLLLVPALICTATAYGQSAKKVTAHATIKNSQGAEIGTATITGAGNGVKIVLKASNLPPGVHGFHIHTVGKCEGPAFASAGGHLNPEMRMHGKNNLMGPHDGDLMNITVDAKGKVKATLMADHASLGEGPNSLFHDGGTALMIHEMPDDYKTDPTGNAGARIACGVVGK